MKNVAFSNVRMRIYMCRVCAYIRALLIMFSVLNVNRFAA